MKKLLVLLLAMLLCLGVLVACNDEKCPSEIDVSKDAEVQYYYYETVSEEVEAPFENEVVVVKSYEDFIEFADERRALSLSYRTLTSIKEEYFNDHYLLRVKRGYCHEIGYRNLEVNDGKCSIVFDKLSYYDIKSYRDGKTVYASAIPRSELENTKITACYDFVLIPKAEINVELNEDTEIALYIASCYVKNR